MLPFSKILVYGNDITPRYRTIFRLKDFLTTSDIVDSSGNNIVVNNSTAIGVGTDSYGTYMNFTGTNTQWLNFNSPLFNIGTNMEIYMKISNWIYKGGQFGQAFLDTRPIGQNGNYLITGYTSQSLAPFSTTLNVAGTESVSSTIKLPADTSVPVVIQTRCLSTGTKQLVNGIEYNSTTQVINMINQNYTISRNAFYAVAATPYLTARIYEFEIREIL